MKHLAEAIVIAAIILGSFFYCSQKKPVNTIRVVGYASGDYDSDIMKWNINVQVVNSDQLAGQQALHTNLVRLREFLKEINLNPADLEIRPSFNYANYNRDGNISGFTLEQNYSVAIRDTVRFAEIESIAYDLSILTKKGINVRNSNVEYFISALPDVKKEIIAEATKDARDRANEVAKVTNTRLGKLLSGRVGVFQITEPLSVEVQSYGIYNTHTRKKQISVTMTGEFQLK